MPVSPKSKENLKKGGIDKHYGPKKPIPPELKTLLKNDREQLFRILSEFGNLTVKDLKKLDPAQFTIYQNAVIAKLTDKRVAADFIFDRIIGKPKSEIEIEHSGELTEKIIFDSKADE